MSPGPSEVFSIAGPAERLMQPFTVSLIGIRKGPVTMRSGFMVEPKYSVTRFLISMCC